MKQPLTIIFLLLLNLAAFGQEPKLKKRSRDAVSGSEFAKSISDTSLSLVAREDLMFSEVKKGNISSFQRKYSTVTIKKVIDSISYQLRIYVAPDYLAIGKDEDYFYIPTTPMLAQRIADISNTMLPTKLMVDEIYKQAAIKLEPQPIPPTKAMTTVPVFIVHNGIVLQQLKDFQEKDLSSHLTAGNKKDIIISNKIYGQPTPRVVIYGWHKLDGKAIQPVYNKHTNTWTDYSHGVRLVSETGILNGKKVKLSDLLKHPTLHQLLSDEGVILNPKYPID